MKIENRSIRKRTFPFILRTRNVSRSSTTIRWSTFHATQERVNQVRYLNLSTLIIFTEINLWVSMSFTSMLNCKLPTDTILKRTAASAKGQHVGEVLSEWSDSVTLVEKSVFLSSLRTTDALEHSHDWENHTQDVFTNRGVPVVTSLKTSAEFIRDYASGVHLCTCESYIGYDQQSK